MRRLIARKPHAVRRAPLLRKRLTHGHFEKPSRDRGPLSRVRLFRRVVHGLNRVRAHLFVVRPVCPPWQDRGKSVAIFPMEPARGKRGQSERAAFQCGNCRRFAFFGNADRSGRSVLRNRLPHRLGGGERNGELSEKNRRDRRHARPSLRIRPRAGRRQGHRSLEGGLKFPALHGH